MTAYSAKLLEGEHPQKASPQQSLHTMEAGLDIVGQSPARQGTVAMIVCRPDVGVRQMLEQAELDLVAGLLGGQLAQTEQRQTGLSA